MQSFTVTYSGRDGTLIKTEKIDARSSREARMRAKDKAGQLNVSVEPTQREPPAVRHLAVPSADYWFQLANARQEGHSLPERLLYMENAVNHLESQLIAERQSAGSRKTPTRGGANAKRTSNPDHSSECCAAT